MRRLLMCVLMGCGSSVDVGHSSSLGIQSAAEETAYPVLGEWHKLAIVANEEMRPIDGSDDDWELLTTRMTGLVQVVANGEKPEMRFQPCQILLPEVDGIQPVLPDSTVQAAAPATVLAQWSKVDEHFELTTPEWTAMVFGANLTEPLTEALPTSKNDERVVDLDDDGKAGVTMKASIGRLYMVMRGMVRLHGRYDAATGLAGNADYQRDFYIFGDNVFGMAKKRVDETYANSETRAGVSTAALTPVSLSAPTCADVLE